MVSIATDPRQEQGCTADEYYTVRGPRKSRTLSRRENKTVTRSRVFKGGLPGLHGEVESDDSAMCVRWHADCLNPKPAKGEG